MHEKAKQVKAELLKKKECIDGVNVIAAIVDLNPELIKNISFELKQQVDNLFCVLATENGGKPHISLIISEKLQKERSLNASVIVRQLAINIQGGGGGQEFYATAGGKNINGLNLVVENALNIFSK